jgi:hypothetical protein
MIEEKSSNEVAMRPWIIAPTLSLAFSLSVLSLAAQDPNPQDSSVAEAARQAREQKKSASKPAKVVTNDSLPAASKPDFTTSPATPPGSSPAAITQPMSNNDTGPATSAPASSTEASDQPASAAETGPQPGDSNPAAPKPGTAAEGVQSKPEVAALKQQLADQQQEVDLLLRLYALDQDAFLSNPDHAKDLQEKAKLDAQQEEIRAKTTEVARLKAKLEAIAPGESAKVVAPKR